jgi:hypothetical protein
LISYRHLWNKHSLTALPYTWSQELKTVTVNVPLPAGTRARDLVVVMDRTKLKVRELIWTRDYVPY